MRVEIVDTFSPNGFVSLHPASFVDETKATDPRNHNSAMAERPRYSSFADKGSELLFLDISKDQRPMIYRETTTIHNALISSYINFLPEKTLFGAGHYIPNPNNRNTVNSNALESLHEIAPYIVNNLSYETVVSFLMVINDITMQPNERRRLYECFVLPADFTRFYKNLESQIFSEIRIIIVSETKLVERLKREKISLEKKGLLERNDMGQLMVKGDPSRCNLFGSKGDSLARCIRGFARLAGLPYELGFSSYFQVMPKCAAKNAHRGFLLGMELYDSVPSILLYRTNKCLGIQKNLDNRHQLDGEPISYYRKPA